MKDDTNQFDARLGDSPDSGEGQSQRGVDFRDGVVAEEQPIVELDAQQLIELEPELEQAPHEFANNGGAPSVNSGTDSIDGPSTLNSINQRMHDQRVRVAQPGKPIELSGSPRRKHLSLKAKAEKLKRSMVRARLSVINPLQHATTVYLDLPDLVIGRALNADLVVMDEGASRHHARFERHQGGFNLVDLQSGNGTYVNGRKVTSIELYDGDIIVIGKTKMLFESVGWRRPAGPRKHYGIASGVSISTASRWSRVRVGLVTFMASAITVFCIGLLRIPSVEPVAGALNDKIQVVNAALAQQDVALAKLNLGHAQVISQLLEGGDEGIQELVDEVDRARRFSRLKTALADGVPITELTEEVAALSEDGSEHPEVQRLVSEWTQVHVEKLRRAIMRSVNAGRNDEAKRLLQAAQTLAPRDPGLAELSKSMKTP
ncbi:MAG: FHA domain-containing protein [Bradymonadia bacterium]